MTNPHMTLYNQGKLVFWNGHHAVIFPVKAKEIWNLLEL